MSMVRWNVTIGRAAALALLVLAAGVVRAQEPPTPASPEINGEWLGALKVGSMTLRLGLHVEKKEKGGFSAVLDSIDQGAKIPVGEVAFAERKLRLSIPAIGGSYDGTLDAVGRSIVGVWSQGGQQFPLTFERQAQVFELRRPQLPKPPFPYRSEEVTFESAAGKVRLAGTLIVPEGKGPFPAIALVSGSGPQDRDETILGHKPFLVIADALARRGVASLRWNDRGVAPSGGDHFGSTVEDFAGDAKGAVAYLHSRAEIAGGAIGILGHSEGGLIGPMVASDAGAPAVSFLVLLAPPGESLQALLVRQTRALYRLQGLDEGLTDRALALEAEDLRRIADPSIPTPALQEMFRTEIEPRRKLFSEEERKKLGIDPAAIERSIQVSTTPWFRSLMEKDPAVYLRKVRVPVLALFGEKDLQVDPSVNAKALHASLSEASAAANALAFEVRTLPELNHLFQHAKTGGVDEYGTIEETVAPEVLKEVGDWIAARAGSGSPSPR